MYNIPIHSIVFMYCVSRRKWNKQFSSLVLPHLRKVTGVYGAYNTLQTWSLWSIQCPTNRIGKIFCLEAFVILNFDLRESAILVLPQPYIRSATFYAMNCIPQFLIQTYHNITKAWKYNKLKPMSHMSYTMHAQGFIVQCEILLQASLSYTSLCL